MKRWSDQIRISISLTLACLSSQRILTSPSLGRIPSHWFDILSKHQLNWRVLEATLFLLTTKEGQILDVFEQDLSFLEVS